MILLIFVIGISAAKGGPRPDEMNFNITSPDYDYVTTLDMFDLLQGLLMKNQSTEVHTMTADFDNITPIRFNQHIFNHSRSLELYI